MNANPDEQRSSRLVECEDCGKQVSRRATNCPQCGAPINVPVPMVECEDCGQQITRDATTCPHCGAPATAAEETPSVPSTSLAKQSGLEVIQLDTMKFLVTGCVLNEVFERLEEAVDSHHYVDGAFAASGIIRGHGGIGITFAVTMEESDKGVTFQIEGETAEGPMNFLALFDPTEAAGWAVFAATQVFNTVVNESAEDRASADVNRLVFNFLDSLGAAHLLDKMAKPIASAGTIVITRQKRKTNALLAMRVN